MDKRRTETSRMSHAVFYNQSLTLAELAELFVRRSGCYSYLHRGSLGGLGCGVTTKRLRALEFLAVLHVLHVSLFHLEVVGLLVGQIVQRVVEGAGVPHLVRGLLLWVAAPKISKHAKVQRVETAEKTQPSQNRKLFPRLASTPKCNG